MWINVYQKIVSQTLNSSKNKLNVREGSSWDEYAQVITNPYPPIDSNITSSVVFSWVTIRT